MKAYVSFKAKELRLIGTLSLLIMLRIVGLFMLLPVLVLQAKYLPGSTPILVGLAVGIYGLTQSLAQIPLGLLSDYIGRRPVIIMGLLLFVIGSLIAASAHSITMVIMGRACQGAGAISSTVVALLADAIPDDSRALAMALLGVAMALAFALAIVLGPLLINHLSLAGFFALSATLGGIGLLVLLTLVPAVPRKVQGPRYHGYALLTQLIRLGFRQDLLLLNCGILILHIVIIANLVALPLMFVHYLQWPVARHWQLYVPTVIPAFILALGMIAYAERRHRQRCYFILSIIGVIIAQGLWLLGGGQFSVAMVAMVLFFTCFPVLEALLPALISSVAPGEFKGAALGIAYCYQFLGSFIGGSSAGYLAQQHKLGWVYASCAGLAALWLILSYKSAVLKWRRR